MMNKLVNTKKHNIYGDPCMIDKFIYLKRQKNNTNIFYIFKIIEIINNKFPIIYKINYKYYFTVPDNNLIKCYCYDSKSSDELFELSYDDELFELSYDEYLNTFRVFINNDGRYPNEIPDKLIQDKI